MSVIGHSIQNSIANVHIALKQQQAAEAARSGEDTRRQIRVQKEEQLAREAVREAQETHENRARRANEDERRKRRKGRRGEQDEGQTGGADNAHLDLFA